MTTKEKILDAAQDLIQTRSFHGFSYQDMADRVGIRKPSLYHHFDSKDAIALAIEEGMAYEEHACHVRNACRPSLAEQGPSGYRYLPTIDAGGGVDGTQ